MSLLYNSENLGAWSLVVILSTFFIELLSVIVIRIYYQRKRTKTIDLTEDQMHELSYKFAYEPEYYVNSVMSAICTNTCILGAISCYKWLLSKSILKDYQSLIFIALIIVAILCNNFLDKNFVNKLWLNDSSGNEKYLTKNVRLLSSLSIFVIVILMAIPHGISNYTDDIIFIATLILGKFIYFDSTWTSIKKDFGDAFKTWRSIALSLLLSFILIISGSLYGILTSDNLIFSLFILYVLQILLTVVMHKIWQMIT